MAGFRIRHKSATCGLCPFLKISGRNHPQLVQGASGMDNDNWVEWPAANAQRPSENEPRLGAPSSARAGLGSSELARFGILGLAVRGLGLRASLAGAWDSGRGSSRIGSELGARLADWGSGLGDWLWAGTWLRARSFAQASELGSGLGAWLRLGPRLGTWFGSGLSPVLGAQIRGSRLKTQGLGLGTRDEDLGQSVDVGMSLAVVWMCAWA
jgi:hypothetical protein